MRQLLSILLLAVIAFCSVATRSTASPVPLAGSYSDVEFTLQVASFLSEADAEALSKRIPDAWVQVSRNDGRQVFRVNYKRFKDRNQALRAQWDLEDLGFEGFIQRLYT